MTIRRLGLVAMCCLLTALEAAGGNCYAQSASNEVATTSSASTKKKSVKAPKQRSASKDPYGLSEDAATDPATYNNTLGPQLFKNIAEDQKNIWTSPAHLRFSDADWLVPLGVATGALLATDTDVSEHLSNSPSRLSNSKDFSNYGIAALVGAGAGLYLLGRFTHDDHKRETGLLAGEAAIDSLAVTYATKYAFGRERPLTDNYRGRFWQGGDSFPSEHSAAAWSIAGVIAHEYPGALTSTLAYGMASAISMSRVTAKQHFPTDVLVGSAIGWFVAQEVYRHRHDPELGGGEWQTYAESRVLEPGRGSNSIGSPFVELDSWVYPAVERLAALGYIHSAYLGMRPWTRIECAQLLQEASERIRAGEPGSEEADRLYAALSEEFRGDLARLGGGAEPMARLESVYARATGISGPPLNDSYHFGQTIINDYGRPYQEGFNTYDGFSGYGAAGRFTLYVRGEYQHAPSAPAYSDSVRQFISVADQNPIQPATPFATVNQFRLLDAYVAANYGGWNFSFGKQSLWWGPGDGGALLFSDNAEPIYMFRAYPVAPFRIPILSKILGPSKIDLFVGKLSGNDFPPRPVMHGEKISFKPTQNLEIGFARTVEFGGVGRPMTAAAVWNSYISVKSSTNYRASANPGKRSSEVDFAYRVPFVRNWLTLYADSFAPDDVLPLANPPRSAWSAGIYMPRVPGIPKLDFRAEGGYTDVAVALGPGSASYFVYWDYFYHDLYTNKRNILGSWIGRQGIGTQAWSTYWFSPRDSLQFGYRDAKVSREFIPDGETISDGWTKVSWSVNDEVSLSGSLQYERWLAPILAPGPQSNWTGSIQIEFCPRRR